jgi:RNA polymerase sigma-70 factor (ECF subfamily)
MEGRGPETSDEELAARAAAGVDPAFEELVRRYHARAYRLAYRVAGADGDAQDAVQEAFLQVFRKLSGFRGQARFSTWLFRIVTNAALMQRRSRSRRRASSLDGCLPRFDDAGRHLGTPEELASPAHLEEHIDRRLLAQRAMDALDRLADTYRTPFILRDLEEMPTAEVAQVLGLEPAAVRQRVHRARLMLRGYLSDLVGVKP